MDSDVGFRVGGSATAGNYLRGNGTNFVSNPIQSGDLPSTISGSKTFSNGVTVQGSLTVGTGDPLNQGVNCGGLSINGQQLALLIGGNACISTAGTLHSTGIISSDTGFKVGTEEGKSKTIQYIKEDGVTVGTLVFTGGILTAFA